MDTFNDFSEDFLGKFNQKGYQDILFKIYLNLSNDSINECSKASRGWNLIMDAQKRRLEQRIDHSWKSVTYTKYIAEVSEKVRFHMEGLLASDKNYFYLATGFSEVFIFDKQCRLVKTLTIHTEQKRWTTIIKANGKYLIAATKLDTLYDSCGTKIFIHSCQDDFALTSIMDCKSELLYDADAMKLDCNDNITYIDKFEKVTLLEAKMKYISWNIPEHKVEKEINFRFEKPNIQYQTRQTMTIPGSGSDVLVWSVHKRYCTGHLRRHSSLTNNDVWITRIDPKTACFYWTEIGGNFVAVYPHHTPLSPSIKLLVICIEDGSVHSQLDFSMHYQKLTSCCLTGKRIAIQGHGLPGSKVDIAVADLKTGVILFRCLDIFGFDLRNTTFLMDEKQLVIFQKPKLHLLKFWH